MTTGPEGPAREDTMDTTTTETAPAPLGVSEHFPPQLREKLQDAAAHPHPAWRLQRIEAAHRWAVATYPELFRPGA